MSTALNIEPRYLPLLQKPMCCAVTCLQMILYRRGYGLRDQEGLAIEFGVQIAEEYRNAFRQEMKIMTKENFDEGIKTIEIADDINAYFKKESISLSAKTHKYRDISDLKTLILTSIKENRDLWIEYHAHEIHSNDIYHGNYIHDGLIEEINTENNILTIVDPTPEHRQRLYVPLETVERAMSDKYGRETGIISISTNS